MEIGNLSGYQFVDEGILSLLTLLGTCHHNQSLNLTVVVCYKCN